jgi:hypothetical protein
MKSETKSADALARELAERAMLKLNGGALVRRIILEETKLRELCACAEALREVKQVLDKLADIAPTINKLTGVEIGAIQKTVDDLYYEMQRET